MEAQIYRAFILCHGSLQETIFYLNIECLQRSCCSLETGDYEIIFCKNPIQKKLPVTFINSSWVLTGFLQGDWKLLLLSQSLLFFTIIYHFLKMAGWASASFCCVWHCNLKWPRHGSRDRWGVGDVGLKQSHTSALKLSIILQSENCMRGIYTIQLPSTGVCTRQCFVLRIRSCSITSGWAPNADLQHPSVVFI